MAYAVKEVRRLIEIDEMPIGRISVHACKDQNVRKGHLHVLRVCWVPRFWPDAGSYSWPTSFLTPLTRTTFDLSVSQRVSPTMQPEGKLISRYLTGHYRS